MGWNDEIMRCPLTYSEAADAPVSNGTSGDGVGGVGIGNGVKRRVATFTMVVSAAGFSDAGVGSKGGSA